MKDTELHVGLELADLRDGISRNLGISQHNYKTKQEYSFPFAGTVFDKCLHRIEAAKLEIEFQKREIDCQVNLMGSYHIMSHYGWEEFDLSDYISKEGKYYLCFIGTKDELKALCEKNDFNYDDII